jgi:predicted nucleotidyltransferase
MLNLRSKIAVKILGYYFLNPRAKKYLSELARILESDVGNLDKKIKELEKEGILASEFSGRQKYYFLNTRYPFLSGTKKIYETKYGLKEKLSAAFKNLKGLKEAYIFGSYARGDFSSQSDIDILLVGSHSSIEAKRLLFEAQKHLQREFNIVDFTEKEYARRKKNKDEFIRNIFEDKIIKII